MASLKGRWPLFALLGRADKITLAEGGTVLFETRSFVSLSFTVRACKFVDLLQRKQFRKELSFDFREKLLNRSTNLHPRTVNLYLFYLNQRKTVRDAKITVADRKRVV